MAPIWHLKAKTDRRFRSGHPWVYSNELLESPKGLEPGAAVELRDPGGEFLARGYGNPSSLIAFRVLSRDSSEKDPFSMEALEAKLERARSLRERLGMAEVSYRLCFGEADGISGLIIDRYVLEKGSQVFVVQAHTAGADRMIPVITAVLEKWDAAASIVMRNDVGIRKLEGVEVAEPIVFKQGPQAGDLTRARIKVASALGDLKPTLFWVDLVQGQKTGFFLDQAGNISHLARLLATRADKKYRILDLCCYVGQWSTQIARVLTERGIKVEVTAMDGSAPALEWARKNIESQGAQVETVKGDVMTDLVKFGEHSFDLVISDPPALIKGRKNISVGTHGYLQLNTQAMKLVKKGGMIVCCSCSALMEPEAFIGILAKAALRNRRTVQWIAQGAQSPDHPVLAEFPEGRYLKSWIGVCQ